MKKLLFVFIAIGFAVIFSGCQVDPPRTDWEWEDGTLRRGDQWYLNPPLYAGRYRWPNALPQPENDPNDPRTFPVKRTFLNFKEGYVQATDDDGYLLYDDSGNPIMVLGLIPRPHFTPQHPRLIHEVWIGLDTNADPRNVLGYRLANSGKLFFDRVVLFHSVLAWDHLDHGSPIPTDPPAERRHWCIRTDIHLCLHDRIQWLLADHEKFIQPLLNAGLEVLISPLPGGQGICYAVIGDWPGGQASTPATRYSDELAAGRAGNATWLTAPASGSQFGPWEYIGAAQGFDVHGNPFNHARRFALDLVLFMEEFGITGLALDDEYCNASGVGFGLRHSAHQAGNSVRGRENIFRWLRYFKDLSTVRCSPTCSGWFEYWGPDATRPVGAPGLHVHNPPAEFRVRGTGIRCYDCPHPNGFAITNYVFGHTGSLPVTLYVDVLERYDHFPGHRVVGRRNWHLNDIMDGGTPAIYGVANRTALGNVHRSRRGFVPIAFDGAGAQVRPGVHDIARYAGEKVRDGWGMIMYFALRQRSHYATRNYFTNAIGSQLEDWATTMTEVMYLDGMFHFGPDHNFFPVQRGGSTAGTAALHHPNPPSGAHPRYFWDDYF